MMTITSPPPLLLSSSSLQQSGRIPAQNNIIQPGVYASGNIARLQNDKDGKSAWLLSGSWRGSLTNITSAMSSSNANNTASKKNLPTATFNAVFNMVMLMEAQCTDIRYLTFHDLHVHAKWNNCV
jgi:hypothetical protein